MSEFIIKPIRLDVCFECGSKHTIHQHHVIPRSIGGTKTLPLCSDCHGKVHDLKFLNHSHLITSSFSKKKKNGEKYSRNIPIGLKEDPKKKGLLIEDETDKKLIQRMKNLVSRKHTLKKIAEKLNNEGVKTKTGKEWNKVLVHHYINKGEQLKRKQK